MKLFTPYTRAAVAALLLAAAGTAGAAPSGPTPAPLPMPPPSPRRSAWWSHFRPAAAMTYSHGC